VSVKLGSNPQLDPGVLLGYPTGRQIEQTDTIIGDEAKIRSNTVVYVGTTIGSGLETGHNVIIREESVIGDNFAIWNNSTVDYGCRIGHNVRIHNNVYISQYTTIEDDVFMAPGVMLANDPHPICSQCMRGPTIKKGARLGVNVTVLPEVTIGEFALIGSGAVVTRDVPPRAVVYGNPARVRGSVDDLECRKGLVDKPYVDGLDVRSRRKH
jgi:acetyltransferase-like isoleucine patch superfamily enzyme